MLSPTLDVLSYLVDASEVNVQLTKSNCECLMLRGCFVTPFLRVVGWQVSTVFKQHLLTIDQSITRPNTSNRHYIILSCDPSL